MPKRQDEIVKRFKPPKCNLRKLIHLSNLYTSWHVFRRLSERTVGMHGPAIPFFAGRTWRLVLTAPAPA